MSTFRDQFEIYAEIGVEKKHLERFRKAVCYFEKKIDKGEDIPAKKINFLLSFFRNIGYLEKENMAIEHSLEIEKYVNLVYERFKNIHPYSNFKGVSIQPGEIIIRHNSNHPHLNFGKHSSFRDRKENIFSLKELINHIVVSYYVRFETKNEPNKDNLVLFLYKSAVEYESMHIEQSKNVRLSKYAKANICGYLMLLILGLDVLPSQQRERFSNDDIFQCVKNALKIQK